MEQINRLTDICRTVRRDIVTMIAKAGSGHPGGSLSSVEILVALYFQIMKIDPQHPADPDRDRFILSKGHVAPVLYSVLARRGFYDPKELETLRRLGSTLQGHPHMSSTPGLDCSSGSLGQGLSVANGLAFAAKKMNKNYRTYCLMGDGEIQEGQIWEAAMTAAHLKLDNLCAVVDWNGVQLDGTTREVMNVDPVPDKFRAFNWNVIEVNGHDLQSLLDAFDLAERTKGRPTVLIAQCVKGKGVSFMEGKCGWHGKAPNKEELANALAEIG